jgi:oxygen-dependent protoporphyrinogen oxidase
MPRVVVIGGGIAGLAAAHALHGADVVVLESTGHVGGKLRTSDIAGLPVDEGAESFLARVPEALGLARAVGLDAALVHPAAAQASLWARGRLRPIPPRTMLGVPSSLASLRGVLSAPERMRAALDLVLPAGDDAPEDATVSAVVGRRLGAAVVERLVEPLLGGVYAGRADYLSMRATMPALTTVAGSLMRAAQTAVPADAGTAGPVFATVSGGLGRLADAVRDASGAEIVVGRTVRELRRTTSGFCVVHGPTTDARELTADAVVVAVPPSPAARLLADVAPAAAAELSSIESASVALVTLVWRRADVSVPPGSGYLVPPSAGRPVKGVTVASAKWAHLDDGEHVAVRCSFGRYGDTSELQRDDSDLVALAIDEIGLTGRVTAPPIATRVSRWGGALPQYAVGHVDRVRRIRAAVAAVPGLAVCGASYEGVGIPACIRTGQQAADAVRDVVNGAASSS